MNFHVVSLVLHEVIVQKSPYSPLSVCTCFWRPSAPPLRTPPWPPYSVFCVPVPCPCGVSRAPSGGEAFPSQMPTACPFPGGCTERSLLVGVLFLKLFVTRLSPIRFGALIAAFELLSDKYACGRHRQTVAIVGFSGASIGS